jgi:hypothetical protein
MSNGRDFIAIIEAARAHYINLTADISNAKDRVEHIRLTALAQEAHNLLGDLLAFETGLVYTHSAGRVHEQMAERASTETPLDIPDFKSPYDPRNL